VPFCYQLTGRADNVGAIILLLILRSEEGGNALPTCAEASYSYLPVRFFLRGLRSRCLRVCVPRA
jgi:hypothetical protein